MDVAAPRPGQDFLGRGGESGSLISQFDWTHLGAKGANYFSAMVAGELAQAVPAIAPYLKKD